MRARRTVGSVFAAFSNARGDRSVRRILAALADLAVDPWFVWLSDAREGTPEEDANGVDIVVESAIGTINVQVKSSTGEAKRFRQRMRAREVDVEDMVVATAHDDDQRLLSYLKKELMRVYEKRTGSPVQKVG